MAYWLHCQSCMKWSKSNTALSDDKSCPFCNSPFKTIKPYQQTLPDMLTSKPKDNQKKAKTLDDIEITETSMPPNTETNETAELEGQASNTEENPYSQAPQSPATMHLKETLIKPAIETEEQVIEPEKLGIAGTDDDSTETMESDGEQDTSRTSEIPETPSVDEEDETEKEAPALEEEKAPETIESHEALETSGAPDNADPAGTEETEITEEAELPAGPETPNILAESESRLAITPVIPKPSNTLESGNLSEVQENGDSTEPVKTYVEQGMPDTSEMPEEFIINEDSDEAIFVYIIEADEAIPTAETPEQTELEQVQETLEARERNAGEEPENGEMTLDTNSNARPRPKANEIRINFTFEEPKPVKTPQEASDAIVSPEVVEKQDSFNLLEMPEILKIAAEPNLEETGATMKAEKTPVENIPAAIDIDQEPQIVEVDEPEELESLESESVDIAKEAAAVSNELIETVEMEEKHDIRPPVDTPESRGKDEAQRPQRVPRMTRTYESYIEMRRRSRENH